jgi:hypothetical protein
MAKDVITPYIKKNTSPQDRTREGAIRGDEAMPEEPEAPRPEEPRRFELIRTETEATRQRRAQREPGRRLDSAEH